MPIQFQSGVFLLLMFWLSICTGLMAGASAGFSAEDPSNATVAFDPETGEFQAGGNTTNIYEPASEEERAQREENKSEWVKQTESNVEAAMPELNDPPQVLPDRVSKTTDQIGEDMANRTMQQAFMIVADIGDPTASYVYENRDWLHEDSVHVLLNVVFFAPFIGIGYATYRKFRG